MDDLERRVVAIDGKTLRGSQGHQLPGVHLLAAYCRDVEAVIAQLAVPGKTNEHKTALELLKLIPLEGTLVTGDAAFTQREVEDGSHAQRLRSFGEALARAEDADRPAHPIALSQQTA